MRRVGRSAQIGAILAGGLALAGCGTDETPEATSELSVTGTDALAFEPDELTVPAGEEVTLDLAAEQGVEHDFVIEGAEEHGMAGDEGHGEEGHADTPGDLAIAHAAPGETVTGTFTIDEPGTHEVYCSVPGHREAGMVASLTVVDDG